MPCQDAMITDVITARPDQTVAEVLAIFYKNQIRAVPVVDEQNRVVGLFNFTHLMENILPVPPAGDDEKLGRMKNMEISLDYFSDTSPWVAKRLSHELPKKLADVMIKNIHMVHPETPLSEGIRLLVKYGSPLPVVKDDNKELSGLISSQTALAALYKISELLDKGEEVPE
ncbi:MAG: CBS domain-containing protein [Pseudomonadota bacterium]|nr:CBS domain-containing protein [Pseudomonadota bacterium]QKK04953.1 MAG: CBS domain-containing protein [Pseudomonadota bacterium]